MLKELLNITSINQAYEILADFLEENEVDLSSSEDRLIEVFADELTKTSNTNFTPENVLRLCTILNLSNLALKEKHAKKPANVLLALLTAKYMQMKNITEEEAIELVRTSTDSYKNYFILKEISARLSEDQEKLKASQAQLLPLKAPFDPIKKRKVDILTDAMVAQRNIQSQADTLTNKAGLITREDMAYIFLQLEILSENKIRQPLKNFPEERSLVTSIVTWITDEVKSFFGKQVSAKRTLENLAINTNFFRRTAIESIANKPSKEPPTGDDDPKKEAPTM